MGGCENGGLVSEIAVTVDTSVLTSRHEFLPGEEPRRLVISRVVGDCVAGHAGLDEGRADAAIVIEGGDVGEVDVESVAEGKET